MALTFDGFFCVPFFDPLGLEAAAVETFGFSPCCNLEGPFGASP